MTNNTQAGKLEEGVISSQDLSLSAREAPAGKAWYHGVKWAVAIGKKSDEVFVTETQRSTTSAIRTGYSGRVCRLWNGRTRRDDFAALIASAPEIATERDALKARVAELEDERDKAQSAVTAWQGASESLEAHLQDRVAMGDGAKPQVYLEILRAEIANIRRTSEQIVASRWADYARHKAINSELEGFCSEMAGVVAGYRNECSGTPRQGRLSQLDAKAVSALSRARDMGIEP